MPTGFKFLTDVKSSLNARIARIKCNDLAAKIDNLQETINAVVKLLPTVTITSTYTSTAVCYAVPDEGNNTSTSANTSKSIDFSRLVTMIDDRNSLQTVKILKSAMPDYGFSF